MEDRNVPEVGASASCRLAVLNGVARVSNLSMESVLAQSTAHLEGEIRVGRKFGVAGCHFDASRLQNFGQLVSRGEGKDRGSCLPFWRRGMVFGLS